MKYTCVSAVVGLQSHLDPGSKALAAQDFRHAWTGDWLHSLSREDLSLCLWEWWLSARDKKHYVWSTTAGPATGPNGVSSCVRSNQLSISLPSSKDRREETSHSAATQAVLQTSHSPDAASERQRCTWQTSPTWSHTSKEWPWFSAQEMLPMWSDWTSCQVMQTKAQGRYWDAMRFPC